MSRLQEDFELMMWMRKRRRRQYAIVVASFVAPLLLGIALLLVMQFLLGR